MSLAHKLGIQSQMGGISCPAVLNATRQRSSGLGAGHDRLVILNGPILHHAGNSDVAFLMKNQPTSETQILNCKAHGEPSIQLGPSPSVV